MPKKEILLKKLLRHPVPTDFTMHELDTLMNKCDCSKDRGGRGSSVRYTSDKFGLTLMFDEPHPGNCLYPYQIKATIQFLRKIKEIGGDDNE